MSVWQPEVMDAEQLEHDSVEIAKEVMLLQNENLFPETGTFGFIMGLSIALGNMAAIYTSGMSRHERKAFERIYTGLTQDSFKHPFVEGTINHQDTVQ